MKKILIQCPACIIDGKSTGYITDNTPCEYCRHTGKVTLTYHLKVLNKPVELEHVLDYQRRSKNKKHGVSNTRSRDRGKTE